MSTWVLRFGQIDKPDLPILVHVTRNDAEKSLDLNLLATDGDAAYRAKLREKNVKKLHTDNYDGTENDWKQLLQYVLVSRIDAGVSNSISDNLDVGCAFSGRGSKRTLSITLRTKVEDITHKLGSIELSHSDNTDDVDLFGWTCQAVEQRDDLKNEIQKSKTKAESDNARIKSLEQQLEDLIKSKEDHENALLSKFALLLNEKKLHIRTQQQQLAQQGVPKTAQVLSSKKRKQPPIRSNGDVDESDDTDAFEAMDVDQDKTVDDDEHENEYKSRQSTPSRASTTSSEDEDNDAQPATTSDAIARGRESRESSGTPPPRELPFPTRKGGQGTGKAQEMPNSQVQMKDVKVDDQSTADEDDDDEL